MDNLSAKRVMTALARKFSFSYIRRYYSSSDESYRLEFLTKQGSNTLLGFESKPGEWAYAAHFTSQKWIDILHSLEGKTLVIGSERLKVNSIEQLVIDLELEGFLKTI